MVWMVVDVAKGNALTTLMEAWFLVGHFQVGAFSAPWDPDEWVICSCRGDDLLAIIVFDHVVGCLWERLALLRNVGMDRIGDVKWMASRFGCRVGQSIWSSGWLLESIRVSQD